MVKRCWWPSEGECLTLHAALVLRRLRDAPAPGPEMAQDLVDAVFGHFDRMLREMGVGDTSVPKRMKVMAEAFGGRCAAYEDGLLSGSLARALARNVYAGCHDGVALSRYASACAASLDDAPLQVLLDGTLSLPDPAADVARDDGAPLAPSAETTGT